MANNWKKAAAEFSAEIAKDPRFAGIELRFDFGNIIAVTGTARSDAEYRDLVEQGRQAGFLLLANELFIPANEKYTH